MPAPERTTLAEIVAAAGDLLESGGLESVTMQAVAARVGVKAPSLYKRVADRDALIRLVAGACAERLHAEIAGSTTLPELAHAFRGFARRHPEAFRLIFSGSGDPETFAHASRPVLDVARRLAGDEHALHAARLLTAWAVGFLTMELADAFQLGGDVDAAFDYGVRAIESAIRGLP